MVHGSVEARKTDRLQSPMPEYWRLSRPRCLSISDRRVGASSAMISVRSIGNIPSQFTFTRLLLNCQVFAVEG